MNLASFNPSNQSPDNLKAVQSLLAERLFYPNPTWTLKWDTEVAGTLRGNEGRSAWREMPRPALQYTAQGGHQTAQIMAINAAGTVFTLAGALAVASAAESAVYPLFFGRPELTDIAQTNGSISSTTITLTGDEYVISADVPAACQTPAVDFRAFDFAVARFSWDPTSPHDDFDIVIEVTDPPVSGSIGYTGSATVPASGSHFFLVRGLEYGGQSFEEALINFPALVAAYPAATSFSVRLRGHWFGPEGISSEVTLQISTWLGGAMAGPTVGVFTNTGGAAGDVLTHTMVETKPVGDAENEFGTLVYTVATKTAVLVAPWSMDYLTRPIFDFAVDWSQGITRKLVYDLRTQQIGFGAEVDELLQQYTADGYSIGLDLPTPCAINALERFFAALFGRLRGFWLPSPAWQCDIVGSVSATEFLVKSSGLADALASLPGLHLWLRPDAVDTGEAARVLSVEVVDVQTERVTLAAALTSGVPDATWVAQRLLYVRLSDDHIELDFQAEGWAKTTFDVLELPEEYASVELGDRPAFAYHFWRQVGAARQDWYYTSFDRQLSVGNILVQHVCTPAPIGHATITRTTAGDRESLEINTWRFDGSPLNAWLPFAPQYDLFVEVWEVDLGSGQPEVATTVFAGLVETVDPTGKSLKVTCATRLDRLGSKLPRFYVQTSCNYLVYGVCCKASRADFSFAATVVSTDVLGLNLVLAADGMAGKVAQWFQFGDAEMADAEGLPQFRSIVASAPGAGNQQTITLNAPFSAVPAVGAVVTVAAGCDLQYASAQGCLKFNNQINFGGHPHIAENLSLKAIPMSTNNASK